jgi:hypothetical protein
MSGSDYANNSQDSTLLRPWGPAQAGGQGFEGDDVSGAASAAPSMLTQPANADNTPVKKIRTVD